VRRWQSHRERYGSCRIEFGSPVDMARRIDGLFPLSLLRRRRGDAKKQDLRLELDLVGSCPYLGVDMYMIFPFSAQFDVFLLESSQF